MRGRLRKGGFARSVILIASGTAAAQAVALGASPILTRLFTPDAFGLLGLFMAVATVLAVGAGLRYEMAIVLARSRAMANALLWLCIVLASLLAVLSMLVVLAWRDDIAAAMGTPGVAAYLPLVPVYILAAGVFQAMNELACRQQAFSVVARNPMTRTATTVGVQVTGGLLALGQGWLILGLVAGQVVAALGIGWRMATRHQALVRPRLGRGGRRLRAAARRFRRFPLFSAPQGLLNATSTYLPHVVLAAFFGPVVVGLYALTVRVLYAPGALIGGAIRQVLYQRIAEALTSGRPIWGMAGAATAGLVALGAIIFLPVILFASPLFAFVFGEPWREAGPIAAWVSIWVWAAFSNVPSVCTLEALGRQRTLLVIEVVFTALRGVALVAGAMTGGALDAVAAYALVGLVLNLGLIALGLTLAARPFRGNIMSV